jgi:hypothetical protein
MTTPENTIIDSFSASLADRDVMVGTEDADTFELANDSISKDVILNFTVGLDKLDVSAFSAGLDDLTISNFVDEFGETKWVQIIDSTGEGEVKIKFDNATELDASALTEQDFIFAGQNTVVDSESTSVLDRDVMVGTEDADTFELADDGVSKDVILNFTVGLDKLDVSAFSSGFDDLTISNFVDEFGETKWVQIIDSTGEGEVKIKFDDATELDASALTEQDFIFAEPEAADPSAATLSLATADNAFDVLPVTGDLADMAAADAFSEGDPAMDPAEDEALLV